VQRPRAAGADAAGCGVPPLDDDAVAGGEGQRRVGVQTDDCFVGRRADEAQLDVLLPRQGDVRARVGVGGAARGRAAESQPAVGDFAVGGPPGENSHGGLPQSTVNVIAPAAKDGVIPDETASDAVSGPESSSIPAPERLVPTAKWVTVAVPPVAAGKLMAAALTAVSLVTVQPPPVRATATRA